jgi:hypothetical protein
MVQMPVTSPPDAHGRSNFEIDQDYACGRTVAIKD